MRIVSNIIWLALALMVAACGKNGSITSAAQYGHPTELPDLRKTSTPTPITTPTPSLKQTSCTPALTGSPLIRTTFNRQMEVDNVSVVIGAGFPSPIDHASAHIDYAPGLNFEVKVTNFSDDSRSFGSQIVIHTPGTFSATFRAKIASTGEQVSCPLAFNVPVEDIPTITIYQVNQNTQGFNVPLYLRDPNEGGGIYAAAALPIFSAPVRSSPRCSIPITRWYKPASQSGLLNDLFYLSPNPFQSIDVAYDGGVMLFACSQGPEPFLRNLRGKFLFNQSATIAGFVTMLSTGPIAGYDIDDGWVSTP